MFTEMISLLLSTYVIYRLKNLVLGKNQISTSEENRNPEQYIPASTLPSQVFPFKIIVAVIFGFYFNEKCLFKQTKNMGKKERERC